MSGKGIERLMARLARAHPDKYAHVTKQIGDLGRNAAWFSGFTVAPRDLDPVIDKQKYFGRMDAEMSALDKEKGLSEDERKKLRNEIRLRYSDLIGKDTATAAYAAGNAISRSTQSGARGNSGHLQAILSTPGIYTDSKDNIIPLFVRNSFAEGLRPAESLAGTYGGRKAVTATKTGTAQGGFASKMLAQIASHYNVTANDCGTANGIDLPADDPSLRGRVLAKDTGGHAAGTIIDRHVRADILKAGKPVIVRSPMTCGARHGLCAKCFGLESDGRMPKIGDSIGETAANSIGEPLTQGALNTKHNCLYVNDTEILTTSGERKMITNMVAGDQVIGVSEYGTRIPTSVEAVIDQGLQPVTRYNFAAPRGRTAWLSVSSTPEHQVLTRNGKQAIGSTDHILLPRAVAVAGGLSEPLAFFAGFYLGDGIRYATDVKAQSLKITCAEPETAEQLHTYLKGRGMSLKKRKRSHDWAVVKDEVTSPRDPKTGRMVPGDRHPCEILLKRLGRANCYTNEKTIPDEVWTWDDESVAAFISGFVTADGSIYPDESGSLAVSFSSASRDMMVRFVQLLWSRVGVISSCITRTAKAEGSSTRKSDQWQITVGGRNELAILSAWLQPMGPKAAKAEELRASLPPPDRSAVIMRLLNSEYLGLLPCADISVAAANELFSLSNGAVVKNSGQAKGGKKDFSGFDVVSQFVQIPTEFKDRAAVAEVPGTVESVVDAPQGGQYITVEGKKHFALPGFGATVKTGDNVEAGQIISGGLASPADITRLRGLGEGRRYFADRLEKILQDSNQPPNRRRVEVIARAAVDNIRVLDGDKSHDWLPDDEVREADYNATYKKPANTIKGKASNSVGQYLQAPALHYSIGTKLTPSMTKRLDEAGYDVETSDHKPRAEAEMRRLQTAAHGSGDWLVDLSTSYIKSQMRDNAERATDTNVEKNYHYAPRLAVGVGFGANATKDGTF